MPLRLHPDAYAEGVGAWTWIGDESSRQGELFVIALESAFSSIKADPFRFRAFDGGFRKTKVGKFKYSVVYRLRGDEIQVLAIMHQHRKPGYGKDRAEQ